MTMHNSAARIVFPIRVALYLTLMACAGVACGNSAGSSHDAAVPDLLSHDLASTADAFTLDASPFDGGAVYDGSFAQSRLLAGGKFYSYQITTDDYLLAFEDFVGAVAVSLTDGSVHVVASGSNFGWRRVEKTLFVWTSASLYLSEYYVGTEVAWSAKTGPFTIATKSLDSVADASADGQFIYFTDNTADDLTHTDLFVSATDGTARALIAAGSQLVGTCFPVTQFVGDSLIVLHCPASVQDPDGGASNPTRELLSADSSSGTVTSLRSGLAQMPFWVDATTRRVLVADVNGKGWLVSLDGSPALQVDDDVQDGYIVPGTSRVVFRTSVGSLKSRDASTVAASTTLVATGVGDLFIPQPVWPMTPLIAADFVFPGVSPDGSRVLFDTTDATVNFTDLNLAATVAPLAVTPLVKDPSANLIYRPFSADGQRIFFFSGCTLTEYGSYLVPICSLVSTDRDGGDRIVHSSTAYLVYQNTGTSIAYQANYVRAGEATGKADILFSDYAHPGATTTIATFAESNFVVNPSRTKLVYSLTDQPNQGLYVYDLPQ